MNILEQIVAYKRTEVSLKMVHKPESNLENAPFYVNKCHSLKEHLRKPQASQIIAEFKRRSPSKGIINDKAGIVETTRGYEQAGASAVSILTDKKFFGGENIDIEIARPDLQIPILRKDFILTTYQITEAKAIGADVILLIAAILSDSQIAELSKFAKELGMEVICEIHNEAELQKAMVDTVDIIGVNNRNLKDFEVSLENSMKLAEKIPANFLKISESGIHTPDNIIELRKYGFEGFLIGETFMKEPKPAEALGKFVEELRAKTPIIEPTEPTTPENPETIEPKI
jgi:indole-3-glycerol phosphate synthase